MKKLLIVAVAGALSGPVVTQAQSVQVELTPEHFAQLDRDKSGGISMDEYERFMRDSFEKLDTDRNNSLSRVETSKVLTADQFAALDGDKDGKVTLDEFLKHVRDDFDRHDRNQDGILQP